MALTLPERIKSARPEALQLGVASFLLALLLVLVSSIESPPSRPDAQSASAATVEEYSPPEIFKDLAISSKAAYVKDMTTGRILFKKNEGAQLPLASVTKVALALVVSEVLPRDRIVRVPTETRTDIWDAQLPPGSTWRTGDLLDYTLVASSNEGSEILASAADEPLRRAHPELPKGGAALARMNNLALSLGMRETYFLNVSGLDESLTQAGSYGSARDIAHLFEYAFRQNPGVFAPTAESELSVVSREGLSLSAENTNETVDSISGLRMGKTGFTDLAGGNLGVVFETGGHTIVAVVLGSTKEGRFTDMRTIFYAAVSALKER